ncbi:MAG: hypothetical protein ACYSUJ_08975, partial [Planctomycetota bacterium]
LITDAVSMLSLNQSRPSHITPIRTEAKNTKLMRVHLCRGGPSSKLLNNTPATTPANRLQAVITANTQYKLLTDFRKQLLSKQLPCHP